MLFLQDTQQLCLSSWQVESYTVSCIAQGEPTEGRGIAETFIRQLPSGCPQGHSRKESALHWAPVLGWPLLTEERGSVAVVWQPDRQLTYVLGEEQQSQKPGCLIESPCGRKTGGNGEHIRPQQAIQPAFCLTETSRACQQHTRAVRCSLVDAHWL